MTNHQGPNDHRRGSAARGQGPVSDARGGIRLVVNGTRHVTGVVEALHGQIQRLAPPIRRRIGATTGNEDDGLPPSRGLTGLIYRGIQGSTRLVGDGLDGLLAPFDGALSETQPTPRRDGVVAALNGVLGDHLLRSGNPLALPMQLRRGGLPVQPQALADAARGHVLLMVHGLCMSDLGWCRDGHDHGQALGHALDATPVYVFYNSGQHISCNGLALAEHLEQLLQDWPVEIERLSIIGHSMGGLVARSACAQAEAAGMRWPSRLRQMVFLGTPHHGAPLERAGNWLHRVLELSPYAAPFSRLSRLRSEGITDLRHGNLLQADWQASHRFEHADQRQPVPLPMAVDCYAIAGTAGGPGVKGSVLGDGLVMVDSALGHHRRANMALGLPDDHCWVGHGLHHMALLSDPVVYRKILGWLQPPTAVEHR